MVTWTQGYVTPNVILITACTASCYASHGNSEEGSVDLTEEDRKGRNQAGSRKAEKTWIAKRQRKVHRSKSAQQRIAKTVFDSHGDNANYIPIL